MGDVRILVERFLNPDDGWAKAAFIRPGEFGHFHDRRANGPDFDVYRVDNIGGLGVIHRIVSEACGLSGVRAVELITVAQLAPGESHTLTVRPKGHLRRLRFTVEAG